MPIQNYKIKVKTKGFCDIHDLTPAAQEKIAGCGMQNGQALFFVIDFDNRPRTREIVLQIMGE